MIRTSFVNRIYIGEGREELSMVRMATPATGSREQWSAERIISSILDRYHSGLALNPAALEQDEPKLLAAGRRYFGSWPNALRAANVPRPPVRHGSSRHRSGYWTPERIVQCIRQDAEQSLPLNAHAVHQRNNALISAATYHFGSWHQALQLAGFDGDLIRVSHHRSPSTVAQRIRALWESGEDLSDTAAQRNHRALYGASQKYFGSWNAALRAAQTLDCGHRPKG